MSKTSAPGPLPLGKLPVDLLRTLLARAPVDDPRVLLGPGVGLDCAVIDIDMGERLLVLKSDPITFTSDAIGHYLVQVNANDIATTGATPRWLLLTLLLPEGADAALAEDIMEQVGNACRALSISLVGGHTEVTHGLQRPIVVGALIGEVTRERLITPRGARPGDRVLLTKGVPIEATAILAREFGAHLEPLLGAEDLATARDYLYRPGIGVLRDAQIATATGRVSAMHDPTEGGLAAAVWELAEASGCSLHIEAEAVPVPELAARTCAALGIDPLSAIASGALLLTAPSSDVAGICAALVAEGIPCAEIGRVEAGPARVTLRRGGVEQAWPRPAQDALAALFRS